MLCTLAYRTFRWAYGMVRTLLVSRKMAIFGIRRMVVSDFHSPAPLILSRAANQIVCAGKHRVAPGPTSEIVTAGRDPHILDKRLLLMIH